MPKIRYRDLKIGAERLATIAAANKIIEEYKEQGYELTLRQVYYQFVSRGLIPNSQREYKNLGDIINDGRLAGLIDWDAIVDRTRNLRSTAHWEKPSEIIQSAADSFRLNKWLDQPHRPEVWIEKDALVGVVENVCTRLDVPYFSCRGYTSQSELWSAGMRLRYYATGDSKLGIKPQTPVIIHLGDHDPSGMDMTRYIRDRLALFSRFDIEVIRIALNRDQIDQYNPPPNPAKLTDSRATGYIEQHGDESWELDALEPSVIEQLIEDQIMEIRNEDRWDARVALEEQHRAGLIKASQRWPDVVAMLDGPTDADAKPRRKKAD
jgi:hypothetical protein